MNDNNAPTTPANASDVLNPVTTTPTSKDQQAEQNSHDSIQGLQQKTPGLGLGNPSLLLFFSEEEYEKVFAAYEKDAQSVTRHQLLLGDWLREIILDWVQVVERDSSARETPAAFPRVPHEE